MNSRIGDVVRSYRALDAAAYLRTRAWKLTETVADRYSIWTKKSEKNGEFEALVPMALHAADLPVRLSELIETVRTEERRSFDDVWEDMSSPYCDIVRARLKANEDGMTLPLEDGAEAFQYARDLLLAAGCAAWKPRPVYGPRKPDQALQFVRHARLGQTQQGSYVIKIIAPLTDAPRFGSLFPEDNIPFSRRAITLLATGLKTAVDSARESAVSGRIQGLDKKGATGVSANFCDALAGLGRIGKGVDFSFSWAPAHEQKPNTGNRFALSVDAVVHLEEVSRQFRQFAMIDEVEFFGTVRKLVKVSDDIDNVTMIGTVNGERKTIRCTVSGDARGLLTDAHRDRSAIACVGDLTKEGKLHLLKNVRGIEIVSDEE